MVRRKPARDKFDWELAPLVNRKESEIEKLAHSKKQVESTGDEAKLAHQRKHDRKSKKKKKPTFPMTKPSYWDLGQKPGWRTIKKKRKRKIGKLRASITLGTVLIVLVGRNKGKRVIFLKQLEETGLLLVCGPKRCNGVTLARINQCYVIATKTKVDLSQTTIMRKGNTSNELTKVTLENRVSWVTDSMFRAAAKFRKKQEWRYLKKGVFLKSQEERPKSFKWPKALVLARIARDVNKAVYKSLKGKLIKDYLSSKFRLQPKQCPHDMVF